MMTLKIRLMSSLSNQINELSQLLDLSSQSKSCFIPGISCRKDNLGEIGTGQRDTVYHQLALKIIVTKNCIASLACPNNIMQIS